MTPSDVNLTHALTAESLARGNNLKSLTTRNILFGSAAVVGAVGFGIAAIVFAYNHKGDSEAMRRMIIDLPPLKVAAIPALTLEQPAPLTMADGIVRLADGAVVNIDPNATVAVSGSVKAVADPVAGNTQAKTSDGDAIKREVTVFNTVKYGDGSVMTGWNYANGAGKAPTSQFCYFIREKGDGSSEKIDFAFNRQPLNAMRSKVPNFNLALTKCVWA